MISFVVAMSQNRVIGKDNALPWRLPADLAYFKRLTTGHTVIMGRKTYESIGRPLPNRQNVILTKNTQFQAPGCIVFHSVGEILDWLDDDKEHFVIGGSEIFSQFLPYAKRMYITHIYEDFEGDTHFPEIDMSEWKLVSKEKGIKDEKNPYDYEFFVYERNS